MIEVTNIKESLTETFNLLWKFKWYIAPYMLFYLLLLINYLIPSPQNYCIWDNEIWYTYAQHQGTYGFSGTFQRLLSAVEQFAQQVPCVYQDYMPQCIQPTKKDLSER